ncbi:MAG: N-acyl-D-amino-acid deacylase [Gammaproteobacteria bacterium]|jgi:N-acyl-D-amino-acid deacylase
MPNSAEFDLVIRGGRIVDGTRMPAFNGDIAVKDGLVAEIGEVTGKGKKEIDANGLIVAPGFIDVHTHYDAQLNWDPYASQSCWHGITSIVIGACGFGFAPCRPEDRERAMQRMTRVEAIPYASMKEGMRWDWVSQRDYLESLENAGIGVNVASYIPQSPIRGWVLGEEDSKREKITDDELEQMKELVRDGYRAGALGLSTDLNLIDRDYDGSMLPSLIASPAETEALIAVAREFNVGSIEVTPQSLHLGPDEGALLERWAELSGRPVYYNAILEVNHLPGQWREALTRLEDLNTRHRVYALGSCHRIESLFNLLEYNLFDDMPEWNKALACPLEERLANLRNPDVRAQLQHDLDHYESRLWSGNWERMKVFESEQAQFQGRYIGEIAREMNVEPLDAFCEIALHEGLRTLFLIEDLNGTRDDAVGEIVSHPYVIPGLSDGGAHTQFLCLGKYPTVMLSKWVRDLKVLSLEEAHWRLSYMSAASIGLDGIGTLQVGMPADIVVYDLENLEVTPEEPVYEEIIGGGKRLIQKARGYRAIIVNGVATFENDQCTGELPGRILRTASYVPDVAAVSNPQAMASGG